ncbi:hypothetical protein [Ferviditalea candida]|uniref:LTXXQ motif family protein n=1 Tax=Ferviditalea candida TaxID=3108399 RepID=A0ABU5ZJB7_9BACL|nr:hypothetical protein [Paenibacillaceae bacterium T2]
MKNWKKIWIPATLALMVAIPGAAFAASDANSSTAAQDQGLAQGHHFAGKFGKGRGFQGHQTQRGEQGRGGMDVNHQEYMLLLAEKYTPDQLNDWKVAFSEQKSIMDQIKTLKDAKKAEFQQNRQQMQQQMQDLKKKIDSGEITKEQAMEQMKQSRDAGKAGLNDSKASMKDQMQADKALHDQFNQAIQTLLDSNNTDAVKTVLPKMLDHLKQQNQKLTEQLNQLKQ